MVKAPDITVKLDDEQLENVNSFCYLGDVISQSGGCYDAITARIRSTWKNFRELLPILTTRGLSLKVRGHMYNACIRSVLLYGSETWPVNVKDVSRITRNDNAMLRWIASVKLSDRVPTVELHSRLGLKSIGEVVQTRRLRWYGHVLRCDDDWWPKKILEFDVPGKFLKGRPRKRWLENIQRDMKSKNLTDDVAQNRLAWRNAIQPGRRHDRRSSLINGKTNNKPGVRVGKYHCCSYNTG